MRQIKFRGKRIDNGELVYGFVWASSVARTHIMSDTTGNGDWIHYEVDPKTVGQFTGRNDCEGNRMCEGDLVECFAAPSGSKRQMYKMIGKVIKGDFGFNIVVWHKNEWWAYAKMDWRKTKIIGNIYDNPELINS